MADHPSADEEKRDDIVKNFTSWAAENFIFIHPSLRFVQSPSGHDIHVASEIPPNTKVLSCPFGMAITAPQSKDALVTLFQGDKTTAFRVLNQWSERQIVSVYMVLHRVWKDIKNSPLPLVLKHKPYVDMLPPSSVLLTTMYFSQEEIDLLKGSNLYQATITRNQEWRAEWQACVQGLSILDTDLGAALTWEYYLEAATHLSSRAFPSTILSKTPSNTASNLSHAVLLPGIDSLNHKRATPVSWIANISDPLGCSTLDLLIHETVPAGAECYNNYGPKPNSELILGYGFALPSNPDDTILLSLAASNTTRSSMVEIGREAKNAERLLELVIAKVSELGGEVPTSDWEIELEAAEIIMSLTEQRMEHLPGVSKAGGVKAREPVSEMIGYYLDGQRDILTSLVQWAQAKWLEARDKALAEGVELVLDDEEE